MFFSNDEVNTLKILRLNRKEIGLFQLFNVYFDIYKENNNK